ncbi:MAG: ATP-binding cassette domain-containing protein [Woeseiaceae bacterium]|nr:ATP-binding cassette domain-containing protein [Woeseiaceae bacterium]
MAERATQPGDCVLEARHLVQEFGRHRVLDDISLEIRRGDVVAIVGGSGSGKSTLMRQLAMLLTPTSGSVSVFGRDVGAAANDLLLRRRIGIMFQHGALFGDLTVLENVCVPLVEHTTLDRSLIEQVAMLKIALVGLQPDAAALYPGELSGGMRKRAAVARAIALDPELLFLDEPSSGLDPVSADAMDDLVLELKAALDLTVVMVTHDMDSLWRIADRIVLLADAGIAADGSLEEVRDSDHPVARAFFHGRRGHIAGATYDG